MVHIHVNKYIFTCAFGWLVLAEMHTHQCYLWHPTSLNKIELPELTRCSCRYTKCLLSKSPTQPDCHILFLDSNNMFRDFCKIGDDHFVTQTLTSDDVETSRLSAFASYQGKIYEIVNGDNAERFGTVDFVNGTLELNPILKEGGQPWTWPHRASRSWCRGYINYLIEMPLTVMPSGILLWVHKMFVSNHLQEGLDFRIFCVNLNRMECYEVYNICERAIFVSDRGDAFCCSSSGDQIMANSIYYNVWESRNLFVYDIDDRNTAISLPCFIARRSNTTRYWVQPQLFHNFLD